MEAALGFLQYLDDLASDPLTVAVRRFLANTPGFDHLLAVRQRQSLDVPRESSSLHVQNSAGSEIGSRSRSNSPADISGVSAGPQVDMPDVDSLSKFERSCPTIFDDHLVRSNFESFWQRHYSR